MPSLEPNQGLDEQVGMAQQCFNFPIRNWIRCYVTEGGEAFHFAWDNGYFSAPI